jgi:hypothetical protein
MATTPYKDYDGNEITAWGKFWSGLLIISLTLFSAVFLIGHWPDQMPDPKSSVQPFYTFEWFHVILKDGGTFHINTLLLILVAVAGFLGNMIHIGTSFTTYVGAGKFRKSWILWYCSKPFTAAALAVAMYFVFRGGFLNMSDSSANINLYGLMTLSILTGLFTDRATMKLKEVFEVLLRPKEERPDALDNKGIKITGVEAEPLEVGIPASIELTGEKMDTGKVDISIEDQPITEMERKPDYISFTYTLPATDKTAVSLVVKTDAGAPLGTYNLEVKPAADATDDDTIKSASDIVPDGPDQEDDNNPLAKD